MKRLTCLILSICLLFALSSCKAQDKSTESQPQASSSSGESSETSSKQEASSGGSLDVGESSSEPEGVIDDNSSYPFDDYDPFPEDTEDFEDPYDWDDELPGLDDELPGLDDEPAYVSPIQMVGTKLKKGESKRKITVETDNIVYKDFLSFGGNVFPGLMSDEGKSATGMNDVNFEIERKRFVSAKPQLNRLLFNVEYMVTNTGNEQKDGENYNSGIYDFDNDRMKAVYKYIEMIDSYGGLVELNYGWKAAKRIQSWFSLSDTNPTGSAPYDLEGYSEACAALVEHLVKDKGYDNIHALCFFNEMEHATHDYDTLGDRFVYYHAMLKFVKENLEKRGLFDDIEIWVAEDGVKSGSAEYFRDCFGKNLSGYTFHEYPHAYAENSFYSGLFETSCTLFGKFPQPVYFTEFNTCVYEDTWLRGEELKKREAVPGYRHWGWETTNTSIFIALANSGSAGASRWGYGTDFWSDPLSVFNSGESWKAHWFAPITTDNINNGVNFHFYEDAMLTNYVPAFSKVLQVYFEGEDIRASAFELADGNYTVIVEANKTGSDRELEISFDKALGKDFYNIDFDYNYKRTGSANVPSPNFVYKSVGKTINDTIDGDYGIYVYTTKAPIKQIDLETVAFEKKAGEKVQLKATKIDCSPSDEIEWKIAAVSDETLNASVSSSGEFILPSSAKAGDQFAITAYLKNDEMIFNTAVISVIE